jgi:hypothetical protein
VSSRLAGFDLCQIQTQVPTPPCLAVCLGPYALSTSPFMGLMRMMHAPVLQAGCKDLRGATGEELSTMSLQGCHHILPGLTPWNIGKLF